jgi:hypothetical protein
MVRKVLVDGAYDTREDFDFLEENGITPKMLILIE